MRLTAGDRLRGAHAVAAVGGEEAVQAARPLVTLQALVTAPVGDGTRGRLALGVHQPTTGQSGGLETGHVVGSHSAYTSLQPVGAGQRRDTWSARTRRTPAYNRSEQRVKDGTRGRLALGVHQPTTGQSGSETGHVVGSHAAYTSLQPVRAGQSGSEWVRDGTHGRLALGVHQPTTGQSGSETGHVVGSHSAYTTLQPVRAGQRRDTWSARTRRTPAYNRSERVRDGTRGRLALGIHQPTTGQSGSETGHVVGSHSAFTSLQPVRAGRRRDTWSARTRRTPAYNRSERVGDGTRGQPTTGNRKP